MTALRRINSAPRTAVLYIYDPASEEPLVEPSPGSIVVVVSSGSTDILEQVEQFFDEATKVMGLKPVRRRTGE